MSTHERILRTLAQARRQAERINGLLRLPPEEAKAQAKALQALRAKMRAAMRRVVAEDAAYQGHNGERVLRVAEVMKITGLGRTTIWQLERDGLFPKRVKLSGSRGRAVGYRASEVARWIAQRGVTSHDHGPPLLTTMIQGPEAEWSHITVHRTVIKPQHESGHVSVPPSPLVAMRRLSRRTESA